MDKQGPCFAICQIWSCPYIIEADGIGGAHSRDLFLATAPDLQLNSYQVNHNPGDYSTAREE